MNIVTFNPFRTIGIPGIKYVKPDRMFEERKKIEEADICLFPENWQVNALVYGMKKKIFPSIQSIQMGFNKIEVTRGLWSVAPKHVPKTVILGKNSDNVNRILSEFPFPFVAKEVRNSMGKGVFLIQNQEQFKEYVENNDYLYIQEYLSIDRDLRICVIGEEVIAAYWRINDQNTFRNNVAQGARISFDNIPNEALELTLRTAKSLGINHAGFDVVSTGGHYYFLEFNTLFGNQGFQQLGVSAESKIYDYIKQHHR